MRQLRQVTMAHEHWHVWQIAMGCPSAGDYQSPRWPVWMVEGGAEFMQWQVALATGLLTDSAQFPGRSGAALLRAIELDMVLNEVPVGTVTLQEVEAPGYQNRQAYSLGYFATKRLVEKFGYSSLRTFCEQMKPVGTWSTAFEKAFGVTPSAFYAEFDSWYREQYAAAR